jgi:hypothetical protein
MAKPEVPVSLRSDRTGLRFLNRATEREFNLFYNSENVLFVRVGTILSMLAWASSIVLVYGKYPQFFHYWLVVISASIMPILIAVLVGTFHRRFLGWLQPMAAVSNAAAGLLILYPGFRVFVTASFDVRRKAVVIAVRDEGRGMDKNVIDHIFEPFFTTKDQRNGTGLGLSICNNIVKSHNGSIEIDSKVGAGTTMSVVLPVSERTASVRA